VRVELDASIGYADLTRREADLALRAVRPQSGNLVAVRVVTTRAMPLTSPEYAAELGTLKHWKDARWITWAPDLMHIPTGRWLAERGLGEEAVLSTNHFASQLSAAEAGLGITLASEVFAAVRRLTPLRTARSLAADVAALPLEELWLVGHRALRGVPRIAALWEFLNRELAEPERAAELGPGRAVRR
jgi:DNA-binding transcriptional LysR family regulator